MHSPFFTWFALGLPGPGGNAAGDLFGGLFPLFLVFGIFYFLLIRPQNQQRLRHDHMLQNLKKGDKIVTTGGLHGTIAGLTGDVLKVNIADRVSVQVSRSAVATKLGEEKDKE